MQTMENLAENTFEQEEWEIVSDKTLRCFLETSTENRYVVPSDLAEILGLAAGSLSNLASGTLKLKVKENTGLRMWMQRQGLLPENARRTHFFSGEDAKTIVEYRMQKKSNSSKRTRKSDSTESPTSQDAVSLTMVPSRAEVVFVGSTGKKSPQEKLAHVQNNGLGGAYDFGYAGSPELDQDDDDGFVFEGDQDYEDKELDQDNAEDNLFDGFIDCEDINDDDDNIDDFLGGFVAPKVAFIDAQDSSLRSFETVELPQLTYPKSFDRRSDFTKKYALQAYSISDNLRCEFISLKRFLTHPPLRANAKALNDVTVKKRFGRVRCFLGFAKDFLGVPAEVLT